MRGISLVRHQKGLYQPILSFHVLISVLALDEANLCGLIKF